MKFMKLGSRSDTFYTCDGVRSVSSEVSSDLIIQVKECRYLLHKFPLLSKCLGLQRVCSEASESSRHQLIQFPDFPGGVEAFELCAKFCYGITITLSAYNIASVRCAAEYLQMTEDVEKGNLIYKVEVFFNSCILHGWKDSIVTLQSTKALPVWAEDLKISSRCVEAIASKVVARPSKVCLSHSYSKRVKDDGSCSNGVENQTHDNSASKGTGWWAEDLAELGIDFYWRTMIAIKSSGKVPPNLIGDAMKIYAARWLPNIYSCDSDSTTKVSSKHRLLLESIISLLPGEKYAVSCSFLLKLVKAANILNASSSSKMELARRVGFQLEEARVCDLLIPSLSHKNEYLYDVDIVLTILEEFMLQGQSPPTSPLRSKHGYERRRSRSAENIHFMLQESRTSSVSHSSKMKVAKLVDGYLQEIACDVNLPLAKFIAVAESIPKFSRLDHNQLYGAIDTYLKAHPDLNKSERKRLCRMLDCKKLSVDACMHAAQNELLPLRVVVQVLFFEQARAAMNTNGVKVSAVPSNIKLLVGANGIDPSTEWSIKSPKSKTPTLRMKLAEEEDDDDLGENGYHQDDGMVRGGSKLKSLRALPTHPKKMLSKLLSRNTSFREKNQ